MTHIHLAGNRLQIERGLFTGAFINNLAGLNSATHHLVLELPDDRDVPVSPDDHIVVTGRERFSIGSGPCPEEDNPVLRKAVALFMNGEQLDENDRPKKAKISAEKLGHLDPDFGADDAVFVELKDVPDVEITADMRLIVQDEDRFYTAKKAGFLIYVNSRPRVVPSAHVTFEQVVKLAFPDEPAANNLAFSVTFSHAASRPHAGELGAGGSVVVKKKGTALNVTRTVQS